MCYFWRLASTWKVEILEKSRNKNSLPVRYCKKINEEIIVSSMIINVDRSAFKFVPDYNKALVEKGSKSVPISCSTAQRKITATFSITLTGELLPMQLIYVEKTSKSIPAASFPSDFISSTNEKYHSDEKEVLDILGNVIIANNMKNSVLHLVWFLDTRLS